MLCVRYRPETLPMSTTSGMVSIQHCKTALMQYCIQNCINAILQHCNTIKAFLRLRFSLYCSQRQSLTNLTPGTGHFKDTSFPKDYDLYKISGWMQINIHSKHFIHYPPTRDFCGCTYPGWIEDPAPGPNEGVVASRACFRESEANEQCYQATPLKMKNCGGNMMYLYAPPNAAYRNLCVEEDICKVANHKV